MHRIYGSLCQKNLYRDEFISDRIEQVICVRNEADGAGTSGSQMS